MRSWAMPEPAPTGATDRPCLGTATAAADLIDCIGRADYGTRTLGLVNAHVSAGAWSSYVLQRDDAPRIVAAATLSRPDRSQQAFAAYQGGLYRVDRSFDAAWTAAGRSSLLHCTNDAFVPEHRSQICLPIGVHERLSLTSPLDAGRLLVVNFYRVEGQAAFSSEDTATVAAMAAMLLACARQQTRWSEQAPPWGVVPEPVGRPHGALRERLRQRCPGLTPREEDVLFHLAQGLTYEGVAAATGVTLSTVKTYRERAFRKLGLHFRSQLFNLLRD